MVAKCYPRTRQPCNPRTWETLQPPDPSRRLFAIHHDETSVSRLPGARAGDSGNPLPEIVATPLCTMLHLATLQFCTPPFWGFPPRCSVAPLAFPPLPWWRACRNYRVATISGGGCHHLFGGLPPTCGKGLPLSSFPTATRDFPQILQPLYIFFP